MGKILELYDSEPTIVDPENAVVPTERLHGDISFENVSLRLHDNLVLDNVTFHIKAGQTVAIMGPTGSGKTMLINLLARLYDTTKGTVKVDGIPVSDYHLQSLRGAIGMTTQDVFLFSDTLDTNIAYGNSDMSDEKMRAYADMACVDFVDRLEDGYDTLIGERGTGLSGGQKQRIALARAMAVEPSILVLDDTTSAVDLETEAKIQQGLREIPYDCTKLIIAQRISSTRDADFIIVMDQGHISEMGTSKELLQKKGYYYDVYKLQYGDPEEWEKGGNN
jgi:ATP-binding cassette subfamily B protein